MFYFKLFVMTVLILGSRLWFIQQFGNSVPIWDQWNGEGANLFIPWLDGTLSWDAIFSAHNEHRIVFTRLFSLLLLVLNDTQWDPLVEIVANILLSLAMAIFLVIILRQLLGKSAENLIIFSIAFLWGIPYGWENILSGFQSAFYLMILFSLLALWGVLLHENFTTKWWLGILCALFAYFNLATGFFAAVVIIAIKLYLIVIEPNQRRAHLVTLTICGVIVGLSILFTTIIPSLHAENPYYVSKLAFLAAFGRYLAWPWVAPFIDNPRISLFLCLPILYLPFSIFTFRILWLRLKPSPAELFILALGGWVILQTASMGYARGIFLGPAARYMDILALGTLANLLALYLLPFSLSLATIHGRIIRLWMIFVAYGVLGLYVTNFPIVEQQRTQRAEFLKNTREFLLTDDINTLKDKPIPFISMGHLAEWIRNPQLRRILPVSLATPTLVQAAQKDNSVFVVDGFYPTTGSYQKERTFGSYSHLGNPAIGRFLSEPIAIRQTFMKIPVAGYLGESGLTLRLVVNGENEPISIVPAILPRESWVSCIVRTPDRPFRVEAIDNRGDLWFAFAMPRGVGILSLMTTWVLKWGQILFFLGVLLMSQLNMARLNVVVE